VGDGTSFVVAFAGALLRLAGELLRQGLHTAEILEGYRCDSPLVEVEVELAL
jgi:T-complex protein 1 subunit theta